MTDSSVTLLTKRCRINNVIVTLNVLFNVLKPLIGRDYFKYRKQKIFYLTSATRDLVAKHPALLHQKID